MKMYHATSPANARDILTNGLEVDAAGEAGYTQVYAQWADQLYGMRPIFLSTKKGKFAGIPMLVDVSGIPLVADLAAIADLGDEPPSMEGGELIWWDGMGPKELSSISSDGAVDIESMLIPGSMEAQLAISVTGTAAVLEDIPPGRIKIATYNESLLREYVRRLLIEQTFQRQDGRQVSRDKYYRGSEFLMKITKRQLRRIIKEWTGGMSLFELGQEDAVRDIPPQDPDPEYMQGYNEALLEMGLDPIDPREHN